MAKYDYWEDAVECAVDEIEGLELTPEQIKDIAAAMETASEMKREYCGPPIEPGYSTADLVRLEYEQKIAELERVHDNKLVELNDLRHTHETSLRWVIADLRQQLKEARRG